MLEPVTMFVHQLRKLSKSCVIWPTNLKTQTSSNNWIGASHTYQTIQSMNQLLRARKLKHLVGSINHNNKQHRISNDLCLVMWCIVMIHISLRCWGRILNWTSSTSITIILHSSKNTIVPYSLIWCVTIFKHTNYLVHWEFHLIHLRNVLIVLEPAIIKIISTIMWCMRLMSHTQSTFLSKDATSKRLANSVS